MATDSRLPQFRALSPAQRWDFIANACQLTPEEHALLAQPGALPLNLADGMIENVIGTFELPMGVAGNFHQWPRCAGAPGSRGAIHHRSGLLYGQIGA